MKKLILSLFLAGSLTFGLQSCSDDDDPCDDVTCDAGEICDDGTCVTDPSADCEICGTYDGTLTGNVKVQDTAELGTQNYLIDSTFTTVEPLVSTTTIAYDGTEYTLEVDLSALGIAGLSPNVSGTYDASTQILTFTDAPYSYNLGGSVYLDFEITGFADFSTENTIDGEVELSSPSTAVAVSEGTLVISGTK